MKTKDEIAAKIAELEKEQQRFPSIYAFAWLEVLVGGFDVDKCWESFDADGDAPTLNAALDAVKWRDM